MTALDANGKQVIKTEYDYANQGTTNNIWYNHVNLLLKMAWQKSPIPRKKCCNQIKNAVPNNKHKRMSTVMILTDVRNTWKIWQKKLILAKGQLIPNKKLNKLGDLKYAKKQKQRKELLMLGYIQKFIVLVLYVEK